MQGVAWSEDYVFRNRLEKYEQSYSLIFNIFNDDLLEYGLKGRSRCRGCFADLFPPGWFS